MEEGGEQEEEENEKENEKGERKGGADEGCGGEGRLRKRRRRRCIFSEIGFRISSGGMECLQLGYHAACVNDVNICDRAYILLGKIN